MAIDTSSNAPPAVAPAAPPATNIKDADATVSADEAEAPGADALEPAATDAAEKEPELITEGYFGAYEVIFGWGKLLDDEVQAGAIRAMTNFTALTHPDHPLHVEGEDGITLYKTTAPDGRLRLSFSLKQVQYIQYYIHTMRLADISWVEHLAKLAVAPEGEEPDEPALDPATNRPIPLPERLHLPSEFVAVEKINLPSAQVLKKTLNSTRKHNKAIEKQLLKMQPEALSPEERSKLEAEEDNSTPGPGLRRAGQRLREQIPRPPSPAEGTGWGGFPLKRPDDDEIPAEDIKIPWLDSSAKSSPEEHTDDNDPVSAETGTGKEDQPNGNLIVDAESPEASSHDDVPANELATALNKLTELSAKIDADGGDPEVAEKADKPVLADTDDAASRYHFDAQQAFVLAAAGGLKAALAEREQAAKKEAEQNGLRDGKEVAAEKDDRPEIAEQIGRSLLFALDLTTWEQDENVVLEVGWAATWFQPAKAPLSEGEVGEGEEGIEQVTEYGHIIVQDHLLEKRNGKIKPDHRQAFSFGTSIPLQKADVMTTLKKKLFELAKRAGGGPVYLLLHSPDSDLSELKKLGWRTGGWETELRPDGWDFPSYASEDGIGKVFVIDTARLFGGIEDDKSVLPAVGKTRKSLEEVASIMFGSSEEMPKACGNAGNDAAYCLKVYLAIATGLPLEALRMDYMQSQQPIDIPAEAVKDKDGATTSDDKVTPSSNDVTVEPARNDSAANTPADQIDTASDSDAKPTQAALQAGAGAARDGSSSTASVPITSPLPPIGNGDDVRVVAPSTKGAGADAKGIATANDDEDGDDSDDGEMGAEIKGVFYVNDDGEEVQVL